MNWEVIHSYLPRYIDAFRLTVRTGLIGIGIALILGIVCAFFIRERPGINHLIAVLADGLIQF